MSLRWTRARLSGGGRGGPLPVNRDTTRKPRMISEVGTWLYKKETMSAFQTWCRENQVRAYGNIKMTSTMHFARCLRAAKKIYPGQAIITAPASACFNFLVMSKELSECSTGSGFPLPLNWMNYGDALPFMKSASMHEFAAAGWMCRIASLEESPLTPYMHYLLEDTRGRDGISNGMSKEREDESGTLDHYLSEMATDACEDPEFFLENFFRSLACLHLRSQPIESQAIELYIPGTDFFKSKVSEMSVPTLVPLVDAVPQMEDGSHNTVLEFFPFSDMNTLKEQYRELQIPFTTATTREVTEVREGNGMATQITKVEDRELMNEALLRRAGGFFALRAMTVLDEGDVLYLRRFPREAGQAGNNTMNAQVTEANRVMSHMD